jgi:hypothetical protein
MVYALAAEGLEGYSMAYSKSFLKTEESFLQSKRGLPMDPAPAPDAPLIRKGVAKPGAGRPKGSKSKTGLVYHRMQKAIEMISHGGNVEFFRSILDDETEKKLWLMFFTGKVIEVTKNPISGEDDIVIKEIELNPISAKMFLRAVEYKRGQPIQPVDTKGREIDIVEVVTIGAGDDYFREQAKLAGLIAESSVTVTPSPFPK